MKSLFIPVNSLVNAYVKATTDESTLTQAEAQKCVDGKNDTFAQLGGHGDVTLELFALEEMSCRAFVIVGNQDINGDLASSTLKADVIGAGSYGDTLNASFELYKNGQCLTFTESDYGKFELVLGLKKQIDISSLTVSQGGIAMIGERTFVFGDGSTVQFMAFDNEDYEPADMGVIHTYTMTSIESGTTDVRDVAASADGIIAVADGNNNQVVLINTEGENLGTVATPAGTIVGVEIDRIGNRLIIASSNDNIYIMSDVGGTTVEDTISIASIVAGGTVAISITEDRLIGILDSDLFVSFIDFDGNEIDSRQIDVENYRAAVAWNVTGLCFDRDGRMFFTYDDDLLGIGFYDYRLYHLWCGQHRDLTRLPRAPFDHAELDIQQVRQDATSGVFRNMLQYTHNLLTLQFANLGSSDQAMIDLIRDDAIKKGNPLVFYFDDESTILLEGGIYHLESPRSPHPRIRLDQRSLTMTLRKPEYR